MSRPSATPHDFEPTPMKGRRFHGGAPKPLWDGAHPITPEPHTFDATYRWIIRSLRQTNRVLETALARLRR